MVELPVLYPKIIYSYESVDTEPDSVLSVFSEVKADAVRLSSMKVEHGETGLSWFVQPVTVLSDYRGTQYAGCGNMKMPKGEQFPEGLYTIIFKDYAGNTKISSFTLEQTVLDHMPESAGTNRKFIVYDKMKNVLFISSDNADTADSPESLSTKYPDADVIREYVSDIRKKAVYILPEQPVRNKHE